ncbi:hypothetical protein PG994_000782 [Apiospora phragmitis]|uniref:Uncharacterized protein n=1 Tax=Apiospora phragmitis TaxID=2905665 RepID=A0ABR1X7G3_9PEZI
MERHVTSTAEGKQATWKRSLICSRYCSKTDWWLEISNSLLSVLCLLAMMIMLSLIQDRPLSSWSSAVSPNAFISVLSTASKAFLVQPQGCRQRPEADRHDRITKLQEFDNASRGPLGSFRFFFTRPTKSLLPYLGCTIILAAIAADSFAQQILSFETKLVVAKGFFSELKTSQYVYEWDYGTMANMQKTVKLSLYNEAQLPDLSCPGSLCEYPPFASLGVKSKCQDVTALSEQNCIWTAKDPQYSHHEHCNFTTPGGFQLQGIQLVTSNDASFDMAGSSSDTKRDIPEESNPVDVLLDFGYSNTRSNSLS